MNIILCKSIPSGIFLVYEPQDACVSFDLANFSKPDLKLYVFHCKFLQWFQFAPDQIFVFASNIVRMKNPTKFDTKRTMQSTIFYFIRHLSYFKLVHKLNNLVL